jgi:hypothetical protein
MKIEAIPPSKTSCHPARGFLMVDLLVGMAILTLAITPLAFTFVYERHLLHAEYLRAVAVEIVDGEMEILAAGEWQAFPEGSRAYTVHARAAAGLPPGHFQLTRTGKHLRLEWKSDEPRGIGIVVREMTVK